MTIVARDFNKTYERLKMRFFCKFSQINKKKSAEQFYQQVLQWVVLLTRRKIMKLTFYTALNIRLGRKLLLILEMNEDSGTGKSVFPEKHLRERHRKFQHVGQIFPVWK